MAQNNSPKFVLSPSGTSLLTNQSSGDERKLVGRYANAKRLEEIASEHRKTLQDLVVRAKAKLTEADLTLASRLSAELNGIIKLYGGQIHAATPQDTHYLLCTDTWLGETTANLVAEWLRSQGLKNVEVKRQTDLQTEDIEAFRLALAELVQWCQEVLVGYRQSGYQVVFNLTGGFKSVQGFLQTLATFYADETIYIFETAKDLLRIPRLPVAMAAEETVLAHLTVFRRLALKLAVDVGTHNIAAIPETLVMSLDGAIALSPWGDLVWGETWKSLYQQRLHPSPSDRAQYGPEFERSVRDLTGDRLVYVNQRIDDLTVCLETGKNISRLDFKPLKGNPCPPSTHEIDAWADQSAKRMFGHFENNVFVLDKLDDGLH